MGWYGGGYGYYSQPTVAELKAKADASLALLRKRGVEAHPVRLEGRTIACSWWGKAWCDNINAYADFSNRVERGKRYVRARCVIDLKVNRGRIDALVQGSRKRPYEVAVAIDPMPRERLDALLARCTARAQSLEALAAGDFPHELKDQLTRQGKGIFPEPQEIGFACSCPDDAILCKHVAAAIMAVAPKLDADPLLLFTLRGVDTTEVIKRAAEEKLALMLAHADVRSERVMDLDDEELTSLFGVL